MPRIDGDKTSFEITTDAMRFNDEGIKQAFAAITKVNPRIVFYRADGSEISSIEVPMEEVSKPFFEIIGEAIAKLQEQSPMYRLTRLIEDATREEAGKLANTLRENGVNP